MVEAREWLIRKSGYYYRPNCSGYTSSKSEAGRYTKAEAEREAAIEPWHMKAIHQDEIPDEPIIADLHARIAALEAQLAEAIKANGEQARLRGEAEGKLAASELAGVVEGWKKRAEKAEAQLAALAEKDKEIAALREACNQSRLAFAGMVSVQSAIDKLDTLPRNAGGKDG